MDNSANSKTPGTAQGKVADMMVAEAMDTVEDTAKDKRAHKAMDKVEGMVEGKLVDHEVGKVIDKA